MREVLKVAIQPWVFFSVFGMILGLFIPGSDTGTVNSLLMMASALFLIFALAVVFSYMVSSSLIIKVIIIVSLVAFLEVFCISGFYIGNYLNMGLEREQYEQPGDRDEVVYPPPEYFDDL